MPDYILDLRRKIGPRLIWSVGAGAVVTDAQNRLLFIRRGDFVNRWSLPAGSCNLGESFAETVRREAFEETGLHIEGVRPLVLLSSPSFQAVYPTGDRIQNFSVWFKCRVVGGQMRPDGVESLDVAYFPLDALPPTNLTQRVGTASLADLLTHPGHANFELGAATGTEDAKVWEEVRAQVSGDRLILPTAVCCIRDGQGRLLVYQETPNSPWTLPYALIALSERADQATRRFAAQFDWDIEIEYLSGVYTGELFWDMDAAGYARQLACAAFACRLHSPHKTLPTNLAWLSRSEVAELPACWQRIAQNALASQPTTAFL